MRFNRTLAALTGAAVATIISVPLTLAVDNDNTTAQPLVATSAQPAGTASAATPRPTTSAEESLTESGAAALSSTMSFACRRVKVETVQSIMGDKALQKVDTDTYGGPTHCLYRTPDMNTLVGVQMHRETTAEFNAAYTNLTRIYKDHAGWPYYRNAYVKAWPVGAGHAMPSAKAAFTTRTPKYNHMLIFVNDGEWTVRVRVSPGTNDKLFKLGEASLVALAEHRAAVAAADKRAGK